MDILEYLFDSAAEEATETAKAFLRANKFGMDSTNERTGRNAKEEIVYQLNEMLAIVDLLKDRNVVIDGIGDPVAVATAKNKIVEDMEVAHEAGRLSLPTDEEESALREEMAVAPAESEDGVVEGEEAADLTDTGTDTGAVDDINADVSSDDADTAVVEEGEEDSALTEDATVTDTIVDQMTEDETATDTDGEVDIDAELDATGEEEEEDEDSIV